jgi:hypothetical protein
MLTYAVVFQDAPLVHSGLDEQGDGIRQHTSVYVGIRDEQGDDGQKAVFLDWCVLGQTHVC